MRVRVFIVHKMEETRVIEIDDEFKALLTNPELYHTGLAADATAEIEDTAGYYFDPDFNNFISRAEVADTGETLFEL